MSKSDAYSPSFDSPEPPSIADKPQLRRYYQQLRISMAESEYERAVAAIIQNLQSLPEFTIARRIHAFWPIGKYKEIDLRPLLEQLHNAGKQIVLPVVLSFDDWKPETSRMEHRLFTGEHHLVTNKWGIPEPVHTQLIAVDSLDLILVPALAVDKRGFRLGYGKGYYDEFLGQCDCTTICPVFADALTDQLPTAGHDIPVDYIVTERDVIRLQQT